MAIDLYFELANFLVILSTRLSPLFDAEVRTVFGFVVLCEHLRDGNDSRRVVDVSVAPCPAQFARYIRFRCLIGLGADRSTISFAAQDLFMRSGRTRMYLDDEQLLESAQGINWILTAAAQCKNSLRFGFVIGKQFTNGAFLQSNR